MDFPPLTFCPLKILHCDEQSVVIGVDGELCLIDNHTLAVVNGPARPFPCEITNSVILDGMLVATWVDADLQAGVMAGIPLKDGFASGWSRQKLRRVWNTEERSVEVAGCGWSHTLDAEPLGMVSGKSSICFSNFTSGLYCIDQDSVEIWRRHEPDWSHSGDIDGGDIINSLFSSPTPDSPSEERIIVWSRSGEWVTLDWETGKERGRGHTGREGVVDRIFRGGEDEWLVGWSDGEISYIPQLGDEAVVFAGGPVQDALYHDGEWHILGWRRDIRMSGGTVTSNIRRRDLGTSLYRHGREGVMVLDNGGRWSPFQ